MKLCMYVCMYVCVCVCVCVWMYIYVCMCVMSSSSFILRHVAAGREREREGGEEAAHTMHGDVCSFTYDVSTLSVDRCVCRLGNFGFTVKFKIWKKGRENIITQIWAPQQI